jgi:hypothetical protein
LRVERNALLVVHSAGEGRICAVLAGSRSPYPIG